MMKQAEDNPRNVTESPNESAFQMEVVADVYQHQQQTQQQSQRNIQSTQTRPYSNAERQKRYREKRKADKIYACTTFSQSSDVQPQQERLQHDVQINKRQPQSNAERRKKYRKLLREQQQQQQEMEDINAITVLSKTHTSSIDQLQNVEQAENARKRHLNKLRQSRFRARQRFKSPSTSSHQAQAERFPKETYMCQEWIHSTGRTNWEPNKNSKICSKHFTEVCFDRTHLRTCLNDYSIPTLNVHENEDRTLTYYKLRTGSSMRKKKCHKIRWCSFDPRTNATKRNESDLRKRTKQQEE